MKIMKKCGLVLALVLGAAQAFGQTTTPPTPPSVLPPVTGFNTNGLSFTNVSLEISSGYEYEGAVGGTADAYVAGQYDLYHMPALDFGVGASVNFANTQSALDKADADIALIKNLDNFQISIPVIPLGRNFTGTVGWYSGVGIDINYNLTAGFGILGTKSGFTFVSAGYRFEKNWSTIKDNSFEHTVRVGVGYSF